MKPPVVKYWEIIADHLHDAGWSLGWVATVNREGRTIWIFGAHNYGQCTMDNLPRVRGAASIFDWHRDGNSPERRNEVSEGGCTVSAIASTHVAAFSMRGRVPAEGGSLSDKVLVHLIRGKNDPSRSTTFRMASSFDTIQ